MKLPPWSMAQAPGCPPVPALQVIPSVGANAGRRARFPVACICSSNLPFPDCRQPPLPITAPVPMALPWEMTPPPAQGTAEAWVLVSQRTRPDDVTTTLPVVRNTTVAPVVPVLEAHTAFP